MPMYKKQLFVLMIILLAAAGGTYYGLYSEEQAVVLDAAATAESSLPKQEITVYVNPDNPEKSMLCQTEYPAFWRWLIPILPLGLIIYDIKFMLDCYHGRRMVYFSKGMKRYKKI